MKSIFAAIMAIALSSWAFAQEDVTVIHAGWLLAVPGRLGS